MIPITFFHFFIIYYKIKLGLLGNVIIFFSNSFDTSKLSFGQFLYIDSLLNNFQVGLQPILFFIKEEKIEN